MVYRIFPESILVLDEGGTIIFSYPESEKDLFVGGLLTALSSIASTIGAEDVQRITTETQILYVRKLGNKGTLVVGFSNTRSIGDVSWIVTLLRRELSNFVYSTSGFIDNTLIDNMKNTYMNFLEALKSLYDSMDKLEKKFLIYKQLVGNLAMKDLHSLVGDLVKISNNNLEVNYVAINNSDIKIGDFKKVIENATRFIEEKIRGIVGVV